MNNERTPPKPELVKTWDYRNMRCSITRVRAMYQSELDELQLQSEALQRLVDGWLCGYAETAFILSEDMVSVINVHGGITYQETKTDTTVYGFDCNHGYEDPGEWDVEQVTRETEKMVDEIYRVVSDF